MKRTIRKTRETTITLTQTNEGNWTQTGANFSGDKITPEMEQLLLDRILHPRKIELRIER